MRHESYDTPVVQLVQGALLVAPMTLLMKMRRKIRPLLFRVLHPLMLYWNRQPRRTQIGDLAFHTDSAVFHPGQHFSSKLLAACVANLNLNGCRVLDMGTGSGVIGVTAALQGAQVVAVDINPEAARLAASNALDHSVSASMRVMCSDLFAALANTPEFDWIIFNPPFFPRAAEQASEIAFNAGNDYEVIQRFLQQAKKLLAPSGKILLILSSDMDLARVQSMIERCQLQIVCNEIKSHLFEIFHLVQLQWTVTSSQ
ncbi:methyltransferase [candidate division KSB1 bacterium]|nr:methyltransferase [candidate division KSB1 bacterium]